MKPDEVTLGERARKVCAELGVPENHVKEARAAVEVEYSGREFFIVQGTTPDGIVLRMCCQHNRLGHVVTLRPLA